jgi:hypothetical protein
VDFASVLEALERLHDRCADNHAENLAAIHEAANETAAIVTRDLRHQRELALLGPAPSSPAAREAQSVVTAMMSPQIVSSQEIEQSVVRAMRTALTELVEEGVVSPALTHPTRHLASSVTDSPSEPIHGEADTTTVMTEQK